MKKSLIILLSIFILFSCSQNESFETENPLLETQNFDLSLVSSNSGNIVHTGDQSKNNSDEIKEIQKEENIEKIQIYSPVYTLTGKTLSGTTKVEIGFSGSTKKDNYFLKQFKIGDKEFITNLRLDYGNIEKGDNHYEIKFYNEKDEVIGSEKYLIEADYEEVKVGGAVIYYGNQDAFSSRESCGGAIYPILIKEKGIFRILKKDICFRYFKEDNYYLEIKNIKNINDDIIGDLYINGMLVVKNFTFPYVSITYWSLFYNKKIESVINNMLYIHGDCGTSGFYNLYNIKNKENLGFYYDLGFCGINSHMRLYPGEIGTPGMEQNKKNKEINFYLESSVLSIKDENYSKNYIYPQELNFLIGNGDWRDGLKKLRNEEDLIFNKSKYTINLLGKSFEIDFDKLKKEKIKMNDIIYGTYEEIRKKEVFEINLEKNNGNFILNLSKIKYEEYQKPDKSIKSISFTSCSSNNSKTYKNEDILTPDENGNYSYNISEELNNKCDIPYKINVYYTDGTKETGEYYILFDY